MKRFWLYLIFAIPWIALIDFLFGFRDFAAWIAAWGVFVIYIFCACLFGYLIYIKKWSLDKVLLVLMAATVFLEIAGGNIYCPFVLQFTHNHFLLGILIFLIWFILSLGVYIIEIFVPTIAVAGWEKLRKG